MTPIRALTDPNRFRITWANGRRFYIDREPGCDIAEPMTEKQKVINCTSIAKAVGSDAFFKKVGDTRVPLDALRVADYTLAAKRRRVQIDAAARIAHIRVTEPREHPPHRRIERRLQSAQLRFERRDAAPHLADASREQMHAQRRFTPIHAIEIDTRALPQPAREIVFGDRFGPQRAMNARRIDIKPNTLLDCAGDQSGGGLARQRIKLQWAIMIRERKRRAIRTRNAPNMRKRGHARREPSSEFVIDCAH